MADGVAITAGSGTTIATDDAGASGHAQIVKLAIATDGSVTLIPADATDGLLVNLGANNDVTVSSIAAGDNNIGNVDIVTVPAPLSTTGGGTEATALRVTLASDSTGVVSVDDNGGALTVDGTVTANLAAGTNYVGKVRLTDGTNDASVTSTGGLYVGGSAAHDAADAGNPVKVGAKAISALSGATMVAAADRTDLYADLDGMLLVRPHCTIGDALVERVSNTDGASTASTVFGATASARNCITTIAVHNSSATNGYVDIRDGTAGTILFTLPAPAYGGSVTNLPVPLKTTANTALAYHVSAAISTVYLSFVGFKSKA